MNLQPILDLLEEQRHSAYFHRSPYLTTTGIGFPCPFVHYTEDDDHFLLPTELLTCLKDTPVIEQDYLENLVLAYMRQRKLALLTD